MSKNKARQGFTYIEILVSISLLLISAASFFYLIKIEKLGLKREEKFFRALNLAQLEMEKIRATPYAGINGNEHYTEKEISPGLKEIVFTYSFDKNRPPIKFYTLRNK